MRLWTIQDMNFYEKLLDEKVIQGDPKYIEEDFMDGYNWLVEVMEDRIGNRPNGAFPIWAWYQYLSNKKLKPDLRNWGLLNKGTKGVRIEFEKDEKSVLLSDYESWHIPLSYKFYIADSEKEALEFDDSLEKMGLGKAKYNELPNKYQKLIKESWHKVFDLDFDCDYYTHPKDKKAIQATFWELRLEDVVKVDHFIAR